MMTESKGRTEHRAGLDRFRGAEKLLRLSQRLVDWYEDQVTDEEVAAALGPDLVPAFRYAQRKLAGKVRKVTLEPAFCHSADMAVRAVSLGYPTGTVMACILHDVVEDTSRSIADVPSALADLSSRFPQETVREVALLTNRFQLIFKGVVPKVVQDVPFVPRTCRAFRAALDVVRYELPPSIEEQFTEEFDQLSAFLESGIDWGTGAKIASRDKSFRVATYLERQVYQLYVADLATQAAAVTRRLGGTEPVTALVVKLIDLTDNIRTSEVSNRLSLYKLVTKAESLLDQVQTNFLDPLPDELAERTTVPELHRLVQLRLSDQLERRRRAVAENFAETRFAGLVDFLGQQTARLVAKYGVPAKRVAAIERSEDAVRAINAMRAEAADA